MSRKCSICDTQVNIYNLHPDNREFNDEEIQAINDGDPSFSVAHAGCADSEDRWGGHNPSDEELEDGRAWIVER